MTLLEAAVLVILVVFVFLQSWRATLIPMIAVPVSLIGAFAGLYLFGFSINTLTLFAIVLATGIVVDDAIVVLENVERLMAERKLSPREAAIESMREVTGAIIAIELVLCSVFIPVAFLGGLAGKLYQQFAVTVATAVVISGVVALTLTPALCALLLKPQHEESRLFRPFNRGFAWLTRTLPRGRASGLASHCGGAADLPRRHRCSACCCSSACPASFVPSEDQGYIFGSVMLPDGATLDAHRAVRRQACRRCLAENAGVEHVFVVNGFDLIGGGNKTNAATMFIPLKPWDEREDNRRRGRSRTCSRKGAAASREGMVLAFNPPPIRGLGTAGGFEVYVQDRADGDPTQAERGRAAVRLRSCASARARPGINSFFRPDGAAAPRRGRPREGDVAGRSGQRRLRRAAEHDGRALRQRLQQVRPHLPRADAGRSAFRAQPEDLGNVYVRSSTTAR